MDLTITSKISYVIIPSHCCIFPYTSHKLAMDLTITSKISYVIIPSHCCIFPFKLLLRIYCYYQYNTFQLMYLSFLITCEPNNVLTFEGEVIC